MQIGVATPCLGFHASHTLELKFEALQRAGFTYAELGFGNYVAWVRSKVDLPESTCPPEWKVDNEPDPSDDAIWSALYTHAADLKTLAASHGVKVLILQPLNQFDGWPEGSDRGEWVRRKADRWIRLCAELGVEYLQVGSNDQPDATGSDAKTASDLHWLATLAQPSDVKIAYEPWCFSPRVSDWEHCWSIIQIADHPNLGLCLDTAQASLSPSYGFDPTRGGEYDHVSTIERVKKVPSEKIFFLEVSDVVKPSPPLMGGSRFDEWHKGQKGNKYSSWVMCGRPVPYIGARAGKEEVKDEAKVAEFTQAVLDTGFKGPIIWEMFEMLEMNKDDSSVPQVYADLSKVSKQKLFDRIRHT